MDVLSDVLSVTRMGSAVVAQAELVPPWGLEIDPIAEAHIHLVQRGVCWLPVAGERRWPNRALTRLPWSSAPSTCSSR